MATSEDIELYVLDLTGTKIKTLFEGKYSQGFHSVEFSNNQLSSGIYLYKLVTSNGVITRKFNLINNTFGYTNFVRIKS